MMPGMNGWEVLDVLKSDPATAAIPVMIVSIIERQPVSVEVPAEGHITKPVDRSRLLDIVRQLTQSAPANHPILVVEDNPADRDILCTILRGAQYEAVPVSGGQEALAWLQEHTAALVTLDLMMPDVSGFEVLHAIREHSNQPNVPVIVVSAKELNAQELAFLHSRLVELVQKQGLHPQELLRRVRSALTHPDTEPRRM
jgi:CheY-like chemotaxis protein